MNDEVNSNFAQDSSMKSNKFQFQEKSQSSISQKSTSMKEVLSSMKDVRNKERQEWKKNLMAKQPVRV